ncbi:hypothetical protein BQ8482_110491 [Mesorhizobium delmotii]|uniref:Uncharacterized protein n=1 Tax=Mesorhizobium delmotii TaxID=1631247 RepID=A0A2P9ABR2_9HYPH|nr:hypothetical protein BQ8482_110491 [Mesorhizobium delmotii]
MYVLPVFKGPVSVRGAKQKAAVRLAVTAATRRLMRVGQGAVVQPRTERHWTTPPRRIPDSFVTHRSAAGRLRSRSQPQPS